MTQPPDAGFFEVTYSLVADSLKAYGAKSQPSRAISKKLSPLGQIFAGTCSTRGIYLTNPSFHFLNPLAVSIGTIDVEWGLLALSPLYKNIVGSFFHSKMNLETGLESACGIIFDPTDISINHIVLAPEPAAYSFCVPFSTGSIEDSFNSISEEYGIDELYEEHPELKILDKTLLKIINDALIKP